MASAEGGGDAQRWARLRVMAVLFGTYVAVYFCRADLTVSGPLLVESGPLRKAADSEDIALARFGAMISAGTLVYGFGKLSSGLVIAKLGPGRVFVAGAASAAIATAAFSLMETQYGLVLAWSANRLAQSVIWNSLVQIASNWTPQSQVGRTVAVLSLSFLIGDALARVTLGSLSEILGYRWLFMIGAITLTAAELVCVCLLQEAPLSRGAGVAPHARCEEANRVAEQRPPLGSRQLLRLLLRSRQVWIVAGLNATTNFVRECLRDWAPLMLVQWCGVDASTASICSVAIPLAGAVSSLSIGAASDRLCGGRRQPLLIPALLLACGALGALSMMLLASGEHVEEGGEGDSNSSSVDRSRDSLLPLSAVMALLVIAGAGVQGPYSMLSAISIDLYGRPDSPIGALPVFQGLQDGAGYLAASLSGELVGVLAGSGRWGVAVSVLLACCALSLAFSCGIGEDDRAGGGRPWRRGAGLGDFRRPSELSEPTAV